MNESERKAHIEEIKRALGDKTNDGLTDEKLESELNRYLDDYHVDIASAKRGIIRKYGGTNQDFASGSNVSKKIADLSGTEQNVDVLAKVVYVESRNITSKGLNKTIISGIIGDETGTVSFTVWEPGAVVLNKGSVYSFKNCYCKLWNEKVQVNIGNRGRIENAIGIEMDVPAREISLEAKDVKIGEIREGMGNVNVVGKITAVEGRRITVRGEEKIVYSGIIADETGKIQFSAWNDFGLASGTTVSVKCGYVRGWKGIPQLNLGDRAAVEKANAVIEIDETRHIKTVAEITEIGGGLDVVVEGTVVDVKNGSGLIQRCSQCNRALMNGSCMTHGNVDGVNDLRLKIVVDDGTGAIGAIISRLDTEELTGISLSTALGLSAARGEGAVARELVGRILLKKIRIGGNVMSDDYGPTMIVRSASEVKTDVTAEAKKLSEEMEAAL